MKDLRNRVESFWRAHSEAAGAEFSKYHLQTAELSKLATDVEQSLAVLSEALNSVRFSDATTLRLSATQLRRAAAEHHARATSLEQALRRSPALQSNAASEIADSIKALDERMIKPCIDFSAAIANVADDWRRFTEDAKAVLTRSVAEIERELKALEDERRTVGTAALSTAEQRVRQLEDDHRRKIEGIDQAPVPTFASNRVRLLATLGACAAITFVVAMLVGASGTIAALIATGAVVVGWVAIQFADALVWKREPARREATKKAELAALRARIAAISRDQEESLRGVMDRIHQRKRTLQGELSGLSAKAEEAKLRPERVAQEMIADIRSSINRQVMPGLAIGKEVVALTRSRLQSSTAALTRRWRERIDAERNALQQEVDDAVSHEQASAPFLRAIGTHESSASDNLAALVGTRQPIAIPELLDTLGGFQVHYDDSAESARISREFILDNVLFAERASSGRIGVHVLDSNGLGRNYRELLALQALDPTIASVDGIMTSMRELDQCVERLTKVVASRNRTLARSESTDWVGTAVTSTSGEPVASILILDCDQSVLTSELCSRIAALAQSGRTCGVSVMLATPIVTPRPNARERPLLPLRLIKCLSGSLTDAESGIDVRADNSHSAELYGAVKTILEERNRVRAVPVDDRASAPRVRLFGDFMATAIPPAQRWSRKTLTDVTIPVGTDPDGRVISLAFDDHAPHALLLGGTGSGKTNFLHTVIQSGCLAYPPDELAFYLADLKSGVSFGLYAETGVPEYPSRHFVAVACTSSVVYGAVMIESVRGEMTRRYELFKAAQRAQKTAIENIAEYRNATGALLPRLVIVIDEFQALFDDRVRRGKTLENLVTMLKQGRGVGVHLLLATQSLHGRAGDLDQAISQIHTRMILPAAQSDARSIFRSQSLAEEAVQFCRSKGQCFMSRDFGEMTGTGFFNPFRDSNRFFLEELSRLSASLADRREYSPIVWTDAPMPMEQNFDFTHASPDGPKLYFGTPYGPQHALAMSLPTRNTMIAMGIDNRSQLLALVWGIVGSLRKTTGGHLSLHWLDGPTSLLGIADFEGVRRRLGANAECEVLPQFAPFAQAILDSPVSTGQSSIHVVVVTDITMLSTPARAPAFARPGEVTALKPISDVELIEQVMSRHGSARLCVVLLGRSPVEFTEGNLRDVLGLAVVRISSKHASAIRIREFLRTSDLPEMGDSDLVGVFDSSRVPVPFRPFALGE